MGFNSPFNSSGGSQILTDLDVDSGTLSIDEVNNRVVIGNTLQIGDGKSIVDGSGNELLQFCEVASAVNHLEIENAAAGTAPGISAIGDSTDITIALKPKGSGGFRIYGTTAAAATLYMNEDSSNGQNFMGHRAATSIAGNHTYTWPAALPGSPLVLQSDNTGALSWVADEGSAPNDMNLILHMQVFS